MIHVLARIDIKPESAAAAKAILTTLVNESRKEPGCIAYTLYAQADAPHLFRTDEQWRDQASVDAHMKSAHVGAAIAAASPMFAAPPEILTFEKLM